MYIFCQGLSVTEVIEGYESAIKKALDILPGKSLFSSFRDLSGILFGCPVCEM